MARIAVNGVEYNVEREGSGPPIVLLHGFTGSTGAWSRLAPVLSPRFETFAIDLLGHGGTSVPADSNRYRAEWIVRDLATLADRLGIERAAWLGYSMGARTALLFAAECPDRVAALILESGTPGIADRLERAARAHSDEALAARIEREGMVAFVNTWERMPMFASHARLPSEVRERLRRQRLSNDPVGLANSVRGFGQGSQPPLHDRLARLSMPVLLIAGAEDEKYRRLAVEMAATIPNAEHVIVEGAGHTPHLEQPESFNRAVLAFLDRLDRDVQRWREAPIS
ncbi:MAG: 2-succinyl-6-hydroxy-2,4-cyclohexadiene-1-carboxylate synthase [Dactylosporangium sp.]|nr:2-succinyl-6-hydroxy-2,4-cyclohexadiene-1-carboxylate synthase [Dactylosporangium sp.]